MHLPVDVAAIEEVKGAYLTSDCRCRASLDHLQVPVSIADRKGFAQGAVKKDGRDSEVDVNT